MKILLTLVCVVILSASLDAQEAINLGTPITQPTISNYVPASLDIQLLPVPRITVTLIHVASGRTETFSYPCGGGTCTITTDAQVTTLINALNTANLSTRSLWRRTFDRLVIDFASRFPGGGTVQ